MMQERSQVTFTVRLLISSRNFGRNARLSSAAGLYKKLFKGHATQTDNRIASHFQCEISATRLYCCCGCH